MEACLPNFNRVSNHTVQHYLDLLVGTFVVRRLRPWHENIGKRQVRSPKIYLADTGILHALLGLRDFRDVEAHPKLGASWESFAIETLLRRVRADPEDCFFWSTHAGAELDLLVVAGRHRYGFEIKRTTAPRPTRSTHIALSDLRLTRLDIVHAGDDTFPLGDRLRALALSRLDKDLQPIR